MALKLNLDSNYIKKMENKMAVTKQDKQDAVRAHYSKMGLSIKRTGSYINGEPAFQLYVFRQSQKVGEKFTIEEEYKRIIK